MPDLMQSYVFFPDNRIRPAKVNFAQPCRIIEKRFRRYSIPGAITPPTYAHPMKEYQMWWLFQKSSTIAGHPYISFAATEFAILSAPISLG